MAEKDTHAESTRQEPQQQGSQKQGTAHPAPATGAEQQSNKQHGTQPQDKPQPGATKATIHSPGTYPPGEDPRRWKVLGVILTTIFMSLISVSIINVALPSIQQGLGATESDIQWVLAGYTLTFGVVQIGRAHV